MIKKNSINQIIKNSTNAITSNVYEAVFKRKDGTTFYSEVSSRIIEIDGVKYYQQIIRDISERKRYETELKESEERFRKIFHRTCCNKIFN